MTRGLAEIVGTLALLPTLPRADSVERARVEAARRLLDSSGDAVATIGRRCGFGTPETMQRAFRRVLHTTPTAYRGHFQKASS